ncbi:DUF58 domain-containing protein [Hahella sp. HN01]|uniref:DUF58 domain-containing protein n=1 Tax=Hahella sp. HN01 TaxID=2847262 RepID=UPI001C1EF5FE|nr:DUF58 domain-containing protein [Hahella sp. HN01]MBU6950546.1 DUF58 domain-containing protein [Hahella sp. HN01]
MTTGIRQKSGARIGGQLGRRIDKWVEKRLPPVEEATLSHRAIFVLPTRWGVGFLMLAGLILLTGINYQNSMILAVGFFLISIFVVNILIAYRNMSGLVIRFHRAASCFSDELAGFEFLVSASEHGAATVQLGWTPDSYVTLDLDQNGQRRAVIEYRCRKRGWLTPGRMLITSTYPMGLIRAWSWQDLNAKALVYPRPATQPQFKWSASLAEGEGKGDSHIVGQEDFAGLRTYVPGEPLTRIAWKKYAQQGELYSKEFSQPELDPDWIDFDAYQGMETELRLSTLCAQILELEQKGTPYGLRMPGWACGPGSGLEHRNKCLTALAKYPDHV